MIYKLSRIKCLQNTFFCLCYRQGTIFDQNHFCQKQTPTTAKLNGQALSQCI